MKNFRTNSFKLTYRRWSHCSFHSVPWWLFSLGYRKNSKNRSQCCHIWTVLRHKQNQVLSQILRERRYDCNVINVLVLAHQCSCSLKWFGWISTVVWHHANPLTRRWYRHFTRWLYFVISNKNAILRWWTTNDTDAQCTRKSTTNCQACAV